jgi:DnaJ-class molecular chaperone
MSMGNNICSNCHTDPNNYKVFTCITCHTRSETDAEHQGRSGYVYNSINCLACHPSGDRP